jgi:tetratricopeptide (TPR) repeat protein
MKARAILILLLCLGLTLRHAALAAQESSVDYMNQGNQKAKSGNLDGALADYNKAIELNPRYAGAYNNRGLVKKAKRDLDGALGDYNKAIELEPRIPLAYNNRGNIKQAEGDLDGALADYNMVLELNPKDADAYNNRGNVKQAKGDPLPSHRNLKKTVGNLQKTCHTAGE